MREGIARAAIAVVALIGGSAGCAGEEPRFEGAAAEQAEGHEHGARSAQGLHGEGQAGEEHHEEQAAGPRPTRVLDDGARLFGAEMQGERAAIELSQIVAAPSQFDGQVVRTSGTIERVCQRMGCWMELRAADTPAVRVPMAGHAFFLPRDVAGRQATIEGRVTVQELSPEAREHLASEGAVATSSSLSIDATSVIVR